MKDSGVDVRAYDEQGLRHVLLSLSSIDMFRRAGLATPPARRAADAKLNTLLIEYNTRIGQCGAGVVDGDHPSCLKFWQS